MQTSDSFDSREAEIARLARSEEGVGALREHLAEVISGAAFKGRRRSAQFLTYIVEQSIAGRSELLKERRIGVEVFGRSPSYDTGEDAIVRVTATDVRKRLAQHYSDEGAQSQIRLSLPPGSYIPTIIRSDRKSDAAVDRKDGDEASQLSVSEETRTNCAPVFAPTSSAEPVAPVGSRDTAERSARKGRLWVLFGTCVLVFNIVMWIGFWARTQRASAAPNLPLPWSTLFRSPNSIEVISSDPNIAEIQGYTGGHLSVSDYANHNYFVGPNKLTPEEEVFCRDVLRGDKAATVDASVAVRIAELAATASRKIIVRGARNIQLSDLNTDTNFILLGSPRSDPWTGLLNDQSDFRFGTRNDIHGEIILNAHPQPHEATSYVASALGWATGQSYAIIAFIHNPDTNGRILWLAGENAEGTEAAGKLVTELPRLSQALEQCGLKPTNTDASFEMLLRLNMMAGSPDHMEVVACHLLGNNSSH